MACTSATRRNATAETNNSFSAKVSDVSDSFYSFKRGISSHEIFGVTRVVVS